MLESLTGGAHLVPAHLDILSLAGVNELHVVHGPTLLLVHQGTVGVGDLLALFLLLRSAVLQQTDSVWSSNSTSTDLHYDRVAHVLTLGLIEAVGAVVV